jgi:hypothetical protein
MMAGAVAAVVIPEAMMVPGVMMHRWWWGRGRRRWRWRWRRR